MKKKIKTVTQDQFNAALKILARKELKKELKFKMISAKMRGFEELPKLGEVECYILDSFFDYVMEILELDA